MNTLLKVLFLAGAVGVLPAGAYAAKAVRAGRGEKVARAIVPKAAVKRLSPDQKAAVKAELKVERAKVKEEVKEVRKDPNLTKPEKRAKVRAAVVEARKEVRRAVGKK